MNLIDDTVDIVSLKVLKHFDYSTVDIIEDDSLGLDVHSYCVAPAE